MGEYTFTWEHAASEVYVTGDFDEWKKTVKLVNEGGIFKKTVELPKEKHQYKFVVDGNWVTNESAPKEPDSNGIFNNVLTPDDIKDPISTLSSAAPESSTAALAGAVPKEDAKSKSDDSIPGAFPLTPPVETPANEPQAFSVNPLPATAGPGNPIHLEPGEKVPEPSTFTDNTVQSTVKLEPEPEETTVSVSPLPATAGAGNPIHLEPGEKVPDPSTFTSNTVTSTVKTDPESYEKGAPPQLGPVVTPEAERDAKGGMFGLPPNAGGLIPESSLPMRSDAKMEQDPGVTIQSAAPTSTTATLAAQVPLEPKGVPETVAESQKEAGFAPEASAHPEAVQEKKELEEELKEKVPEEPAAAESSAVGQAGAAAAAGATATASTFAAATYAAKEKAAETVGLNGQATASEVPEVVAESQKAAHASPEASANSEAVEEKKEVETELLKEVKKVTESGEPASKPAVPETAQPAVDSRDVSPMSKQPTSQQTQPTVTTGVDSSTTEAKTAPETPKKDTTAPESAKATPESVASGATDKKKKRRSLFGKLKEKFSGK